MVSCNLYGSYNIIRVLFYSMGDRDPQPPLPVLKIRRRRKAIDENPDKKRKSKPVYEVESPPGPSSPAQELVIPISILSPPITPGKPLQIFNFLKDDAEEQVSFRGPDESSDDEPLIRHKEPIDILNVEVVVPPPKTWSTSNGGVIVVRQTCDAPTQTESGPVMLDNQTQTARETCEHHTQTEPSLEMICRQSRNASTQTELWPETCSSYSQTTPEIPTTSTYGAMTMPTSQEKTTELEPTGSQYDVPFLFKPYQPRRIAETSLGQHVIFHKYYEAIEIISFNKKDEEPGIFPTKWLFITCLYWDEFRSERVLARIGRKGNWPSSYDNVTCDIEVQDNGAIWATRNGTTVVIRYPDGSTGDIFQCNPSPVVKRTQGGAKNCVPTEDIALDCPYWHNVVDKLKFKSRKGFSKIVGSPDDGVSCMVCVEENGQIDVQRNNVRVRIRVGA